MNRLLHPFVRRLVKAQYESERTRHDELAAKADRNALLLAEILISFREKDRNLSFAAWEFSVFSQFGEDGIIQNLLRRVPIEQRTFVEFGVESYRESNTRFLLIRENWSGLVIDGSPSHVRTIQEDPISWRHDLTSICSFITCENINALIATRFSGDIGLLSIDIDGNDYWVWKSIEVISPRIVVCEFNSVFGAQGAVTVPYIASFVRATAHHSMLYFGASLSALCSLAEQKGYVFVGCNAAGNNAFFVRRDVAQHVPALSAKEGYVRSKFREARDEQGRLSFASHADQLRLISDLEVFDIADQRLHRIGDKTSRLDLR